MREYSKPRITFLSKEITTMSWTLDDDLYYISYSLSKRCGASTIVNICIICNVVLSYNRLIFSITFSREKTFTGIFIKRLLSFRLTYMIIIITYMCVAHTRLFHVVTFFYRLDKSSNARNRSRSTIAGAPMAIIEFYQSNVFLFLLLLLRTVL